VTYARIEPRTPGNQQRPLIEPAHPSSGIMTGPADRWIRRITIGCAGMLALIAGTVSYLHMHRLVLLHGQPGWVAALTPLSVDGMIWPRRCWTGGSGGPIERGGEARVLAWQWALANRSDDGSLPSGRDIACEHGRHERWGRLVKRSGLVGQLDPQT
jgi:hypothetical protein